MSVLTGQSELYLARYNMSVLTAQSELYLARYNMSVLTAQSELYLTRPKQFFYIQFITNECSGKTCLFHMKGVDFTHFNTCCTYQIINVL